MTNGKDLTFTIEKKLESFMKIRILHPKMKQLLIQLKALIELPGGNEIILLMGPSGVGKSTLIEELCNEIIQTLIGDLEGNKSKLPLVKVELVSPDNGLFNWKDFYIRILQATNEPLINKKILYETNEDKVEIKKVFANHNPRTAPELRRSVENVFYYRDPKVLIIDEAQHFTKMASGKRYTDQLDTLKSLSNLTQIPQLLVGTYELKDFVNLNGQLARRTMDIQFPRYDFNIKDDFNNYLGIIQGLLGQIPINISLEEVIGKYEFIYERTLGCVGILKDWLVRSLKVALEEDCDELKIEHMESTALSINKISKLLEEIEVGESLFIDKEETVNSVRGRLGLSVLSSAKKASKTGRVGVRNPTRDKVGRD